MSLLGNRRWLTLPLANRIAILATIVSLVTTISIVAVVAQQSLSIISDLERSAANRELEKYEALFLERVSGIKKLTVALGRIFAAETLSRKSNSFGSSSPENAANLFSAKAQASAIFDKQLFSFPDMRVTRIVSLSPRTGMQPGKDISLVTWQNGVPQIAPQRRSTPELDEQAITSLSAIEPGQARLSPINIESISNYSGDTVIVTIQSSTVLLDPLTYEKIAILIIEVELTNFLERITFVDDDEQARISIWSTADRESGQKGVVQGASSEFKFADDAYHKKNRLDTPGMLVFTRSVADGEYAPVAHINYFLSRANVFSHSRYLVILTLFLMVLSGATALISGKFAAAPVAKMIKGARDIATGKGSIEELEALAQDDDSSVMIEAIDVLRQRFDERGMVLSRVLARLNVATGAAGIGVWETVNQEEAEFWNTAMLEKLGAPSSNKSHRLREFVHPDDLELFENTLENISGVGTRCNMEIRLRVASGCYRMHQFSGYIRKSLENQDNSLVAALIDVEEFKRVEKMKSEFISSVSHEMRTPLTSITGSIDILDAIVGAQGNDVATEICQVARRNCESLLRIIEDILDVSKAEAGMLTVVKRKGELAPCLREAVEECNHYRPEKEIKLELDIKNETLVTEFDPNRIRQVVKNLVSNSIKFSPKSSTVIISMRESDPGWVVVSVKDEGIGVADDMKDRLFVQFAQGNLEDNTAYGGAGLGLVVSKKLIELHGGEIGFKDIAQGSVFYFKLPLLAD